MNTNQELNVPLKFAIEEYGNATNLAQALGVSKGAVSQYRAKGKLPESKTYLFALLWLGRHWYDDYQGETVGAYFGRELFKSATLNVSPEQVLCPFLCYEQGT